MTTNRLKREAMDRAAQVVEMKHQGFTRAQILQQMGICRKTYDRHLQRMEWNGQRAIPVSIDGTRYASIREASRETGLCVKMIKEMIDDPTSAGFVRA